MVSFFGGGGAGPLFGGSMFNNPAVQTVTQTKTFQQSPFGGLFNQANSLQKELNTSAKNVAMQQVQQPLQALSGVANTIGGLLGPLGGMLGLGGGQPKPQGGGGGGGGSGTILLLGGLAVGAVALVLILKKKKT